ncbi:MAG: galactose mutarotase [Clostridia bacterium]|nr:galactose mutarotase [Clostridia bacterium]
MITIQKELYDTYKGREVHLYTLSNDFLSVGIMDFGASVQYIKLLTPDGGKDICEGFRSVEEYVSCGMYCGATVGRTANRIRGARFSLDGTEYRLSKNQGENHHHGGTEGFDKKFYSVSCSEDGKLSMSLVSPDGDEGYPGELRMSVQFSLEGRSLKILYTGISSKDTLWAPTSHIYFCLDGEKGGILDTVLTLYADSFTPCDSESIPTGEIRPVSGTPFDFTSPKPIGLDIEKECRQLEYAKGYDHNFVLKGSHAATAEGKDGICVDVYTDMPGVHFYSGNYIDAEGKYGRIGFRSGFALEPQFFPNAVNVEGFRTPLLPAGLPLTHCIRYDFSVKGE